VPLTHYPKITNSIALAWVQPPPPDVPSKEGLPNFLGRPFSEMNLFQEPIAPGASVVGYHDAQPFTRFYGSVASDVALEVVISFSNDEVAADGHWITDDNIAELHYDAHGLRQLYDPKKQEQTGKLFTIIAGRWVRVEIKNIGDRATNMLRAIVRGSVF
jgi:hypothetical protein